MMKKKWCKLAALALTCGSLLAAGCGGGGDKKEAASGGKKVSGNVMVYTSMYPDVVNSRVKPAVQKAFPDLKVNWFQGGTEKIKTKIAGEIKADKISDDVLMVADPSYYIYLKEKGLLLDYKSPEIKHHIMEVDKDGAWTSVRVCNMIIAYNKDKIAKEDIPTSWEDLTNPKYKGRIAMPNPLLSGTAYVAVGALADKFGWEYFDRLKANGLRVEEGNSAIQNKLLTGEYMAAIILEENVLKLQQTKKEPLEVVYPKEGCILISSPIGIFKATKNPDGAKALTDWWLSKEGQEAVTAGWMYSVRDDVEKPQGSKHTLKELLQNAIKVDWDKLTKNEAQIKEEIRSRVLDR